MSRQPGFGIARISDRQRVTSSPLHRVGSCTGGLCGLAPALCRSRNRCSFPCKCGRLPSPAVWASWRPSASLRVRVSLAERADLVGLGASPGDRPTSVGGRSSIEVVGLWAAGSRSGRGAAIGTFSANSGVLNLAVGATACRAGAGAVAWEELGA